ncbi:DUF6090 family protein [Fulvivirga sedimenti]|uniref:Uncharacterized protein n=1 Tax=Fulvivirga sedimenti TaxID=2879465 RepID=A0A9X1HMB9_9BACT|nr:DUF6090 family protein [Fulvivirga sedimenti]MCA6074051.1 hypothetical protein [Fulvivirga sedimenti]
MIKFLGRIRYKLMEKNKIGQYLKYAVGEIILVVIGILLALQINNWNNEKNNRIESERFMDRLLKEVRYNIEATNREIDREKDQIGSTVAILDMFNTDASKRQSRTLDSMLFICIGKNQIELKLSTLNEGLNTGSIALIPSDSLRTLLYGLQTLVDEIKHMEEINAEDIDNNLTPFLYEHLNWRTMDAEFSEYSDESGNTAFPEHDNLNVLQYMLFENLIDNRFYNSKEQLEEYENFKNTLELLEQMLE